MPPPYYSNKYWSILYSMLYIMACDSAIESRSSSPFELPVFRYSGSSLCWCLCLLETVILQAEPVGNPATQFKLIIVVD